VTSNQRLVLGLAYGAVLSTLALFLAGVGHGTYAPTIASSSFLLFVPQAGFFLALIGAPILWASYFRGIAGIESSTLRHRLVVGIILLHLAPGVWSALDDPAFTRALHHDTLIILLYLLTFAAAIISLMYVSFFPKSRKYQAERIT
jgi:hypothetical protein